MSSRRAPGKRPERRTVDVEIADGAYQGWAATIYADFSVRTLAELQSGQLDRIVPAFAKIVVSHNFPDESGAIAAELVDVDPYDGLLRVAAEAFKTIERLPPR